MPPKKKKKVWGPAINITVIPGTCLFCGDSEDNEEKYGKMMTKSGLSVHYFCMLFSSALKQLGKTDDDGFLGFLAVDIKKEVRRGKRLKCSFCKKPGATIGCVNSTCRQKYHYRCGVDQDVLYQFFGSFSSFCAEHRPHQAAPTRERLSFKGCAKSSCAICLSSVSTRASNHTLRSPCCKNAWFHRACIQSMANSSGLHFFKCPLCNNKELFQQEMLIFGIYIPDQDAAWELEPNAFQDLMHIVSSCHAETCICPFGRDVNRMDSEWEIMRCDICGSQGTHFKCSNLQNAMSDWACQDCTGVVGKNSAKAVKEKSSPIPKDYLEAKMKYGGSSKNSGGDLKNSNSSKKSKCRKLFVPCSKKNKETKKSKSKKGSKDSQLSSVLDSSLHELTAHSEAEIHSGQDFSPYLKHSTSSSEKKLTSSIKRKYKKTKRGRPRLDITGLIKNGEVNGKKLKKAKSLGDIIQLKGEPKNKRRATRRSQMAEEAILELCASDVSKHPIWLKSLYKEDIITGKNLGNRFVKESQLLASGGVKPPDTDDDHHDGLQENSKDFYRETDKTEDTAGICDLIVVADRTKDIKEEVHGRSDHNCKEFKQLLLTNFLNGGKAKKKNASSEAGAVTATQVKKTNKLRLIKKRKRSEDSVKCADLHQFLLKPSKSESEGLSPHSGEKSGEFPGMQQKENREHEEKIWGTPEPKKKRAKKGHRKAGLLKAKTTAPLQEICSNMGSEKCGLSQVQKTSATCANMNKENLEKEETTETGSSSKQALSFNQLMKDATTLDLNGNYSPAKKPCYKRRAYRKSTTIESHPNNTSFFKEDYSSKMECGMSTDDFGIPVGWGRGSADNSLSLSESSNGVNSKSRKTKACNSLSTIVVNSDSEPESPPALSPQDNCVRINLVSESEAESLPSLSPKMSNSDTSKKIPLINLVSELGDSDTVSCEEDNLIDIRSKFPSFSDFVKWRSKSAQQEIYCDLGTDVTDQEADSLIVLDDSVEEIPSKSGQNQSVIDLSFCVQSDENEGNNGNEGNSETLSLRCTVDYSGFMLEPPSSYNKEQSQTTSHSNLKSNRPKVVMPQTDFSVENSSSFVDLGRYEGSQICVIS